jgi:hypothetical protein
MGGNSKGQNVLFVLHQMGTLDHANALIRQLRDVGITSHAAFGESDLSLPEWFSKEQPDLIVIDDPLDAIADRRYDAVVMQMPYDNLKDPVWSTIGTKDAFTVYSGYGVGPHLVKWDQGVYNLPFYGRCSVILANSPYTRGRYLASEHPPLTALWTGDPLLYDLHHSTESPNDYPTILWAPHWSEKWVNGEPGFSTWKSTVRDVLAIARLNPTVQFTVRGHPLMKVGGEDRLSRKATKFYNKLLDLPNAHLSTTSMKQDILDSTALITDGVSIIAYYAATGKPMAVIRPGKRWPPFNPTGKAFVGLSDTVHNSRSIRSWLRLACRSELESSSERQAITAQLFPLRDESPAQLLLDEMNEQK